MLIKLAGLWDCGSYNLHSFLSYLSLFLIKFHETDRRWNYSLLLPVMLILFSWKIIRSFCLDAVYHKIFTWRKPLSEVTIYPVKLFSSFLYHNKTKGLLFFNMFIQFLHYTMYIFPMWWRKKKYDRDVKNRGTAHYSASITKNKNVIFHHLQSQFLLTAL